MGELVVAWALINGDGTIVEGITNREACIQAQQWLLKRAHTYFLRPGVL